MGHEHIEDIARVVREMLEECTYHRLKVNVEKAAQVHCWEKEGEKYCKLVTELMGA